jgi:hypothetical protein
MFSPLIKLITAGISTLLVLVFVFGLAESISSGFAGFWGGLPFWVIASVVMLMALYDFYDETIRKK